MKKTIVGIGEILWDMLPSGKALGGAPANFAYHAGRLGEEGWAVSAVGDDALGREILDLVATLPPGLRSAFNLFVLDGYSHADVGELLGITEQSSRSQVSRARSLLQEKIKTLYERKK